MLLGYNKDGIIEFVFTDDAYLVKQFPNNSAKISNFWGVSGSHLRELFVDLPKDFKPKEHKVIDGRVVRIPPENLEKVNSSIVVETVVSEKQEVKSETNSSSEMSRGQTYRTHS
jgi:hypothetical protein